MDKQNVFFDEKEKFKHILDTLIEGIQIVGYDWRYLYANDALIRHSKYKREELIGRTMMECYPGFENTDVFRILEQCMNDRLPKNIENHFVYPDGTSEWFELRIQAIDAGICILSLDISERKKAEEKHLDAEINYREIFEKACDAIYIHEIETGKVIDVNQRSCELTGFTKEELLNNDPSEFITDHPDYTLEKAIAYITKAAAGEAQTFEWLGKMKDGSSSWFEVNLKRATIAGEDRILAFFREINERKRIQQEIQALNETLEQKVVERTAQLLAVNKELEAFSYSVSHDLRAPLRALHGYSKMFEEDYIQSLDEEALRLLGNIQFNAQKMGKLIDDLLAFSRLGRKELVVTEINMDELVEGVLIELSKTQENHATIKLGILHPAQGDYALISQVWINLISNAIKYSSKKEKPVIEISSEANEKEIIYLVKDNGAGFNMKYADKLFGVFQRLHNPSEFDGTGIGLATIQRILVKHEGKIWAEAEIDRGASFYFTLPRT